MIVMQQARKKHRKDVGMEEVHAPPQRSRHRDDMIHDAECDTSIRESAVAPCACERHADHCSQPVRRNKAVRRKTYHTLPSAHARSLHDTRPEHSPPDYIHLCHFALHPRERPFAAHSGLRAFPCTHRPRTAAVYSTKIWLTSFGTHPYFHGPTCIDTRGMHSGSNHFHFSHTA